MSQLTPVALCKCLADETRLHAVMLLSRYGELCVCDLVGAMAQPQPTVSRHLAQLRACDLVTARRAGQWMHYRLADDLPEWAISVMEQLGAAAGEHSADLWQRASACCAPSQQPERSNA